jgi:NAD(P)-dependent dehydrogenase (short-subunit alcohol dehydrogenase family)
MMQTGGGAIVNVSTNLTKMSEPLTGAYTASKAGVEALTRIAAAEYGKHGIRINAVNPGAVDTPMLRRIYPEEVLEELRRTSPLGKIGLPIDIAHAVLWLCSPMAGHIHGTTLVIDGGS